MTQCSVDEKDVIALEIEGISKIYQGTVALNDVDLSFKKGEVSGIIGKNGAGKSTLVNIISGIIQPSMGKIKIKGKEFNYLSPILAKSLGIAIVTQRPEIIPDFNLVQNLYLPRYQQNKMKLLNWRQMQSHTKELFERVGFHVDVNLRMSDLSLGEQQLFLVIKAFYHENAEIVLLDEVTTAFTRKEQEYFYDLVREQRKRGKTIIFISHRMDEILEICDQVSVIRDGRVVATLRSSETNLDNLSSLIVGEAFRQKIQEETTPGPLVQEGEQTHAIELLRIDKFTRNGYFYDISFQLHRGEVLGIAGLVGSGRTSILRAIGGLEPCENGTIQIEGKPMKPFQNSFEALKEGVVYLTENREEEGLVDILSVRNNLSLSYLARIAKAFWINRKNEMQLASNLINAFEILTHSQDEEVQNLSGGNKQKVLCGRIASTEAKVFLLDEPTKGIDISAKVSILKAIREKLTKNAGVVLTSPGIDDLLEICDRILVLYEGRLIKEFSRDCFSEYEIYRAIQGLI